MGKPIVYGADYSVYVRIVRLVLAEKGIDYELVPVDVFAAGGVPAWYFEHHPFGRIPAFEHDGFRLFETSAIARYVDEAFDGPALQPKDPRARATMNQIIGIIDSYAYPNMITKIVMQRMVHPMLGAPVDEAVIRDGIPTAELCLKEFERLMTNSKYLVGDRVTLADLFLVPIYHYLRLTPEGQDLLKPRARIGAWWDLMKDRSSVVTTEPKFG